MVDPDMLQSCLPNFREAASPNRPRSALRVSWDATLTAAGNDLYLTPEGGARHLTP